ncbi:MAG: hypothetical protein JXR60_09795 [Bacteroidales bacterium]|nr:hypothetical protein [Bacteroidales bacterium]
MKIKFSETIIPPVLGILAVLLTTVIFNVIFRNGNAFCEPDHGFFRVIIPIIALIAITIQFFITIPIWQKYNDSKKILGMSLVLFTSLLCFISGVVFGFVFWEKSYGVTELLLLSLTGIVAFLIYWIVNLQTLIRINKQLYK